MVNLRKIFKRAKIGRAAFFATWGAVAVGGVCVDFAAAQDAILNAAPQAPIEDAAPFVAAPVEDAAPIEDAEVVASPATRAGRSLAVVAKESENCGVLLVGVDKYDADKALPELRHASDDVRKLRDALTDEIGLPREAIRMFVSDGRNRERPQYAAIMKALQEILAASGPKSTVVVALSGHGFETENGDAAFCPEDVGAKFDGEKTVINPEKAILIKDVAKALEKDDAGFKLLIVDACRNPIGKSKSASGARSFSRVADPKGVAFLQSCASGQVSYEHPDLAGGVFTHFFTEGLRGAADLDGDGGFTFNDVCDYAKSQTYRFVDDELREEQTPFVTASFVDFWLKKPSVVSPPLPPSSGSGWLPLALLALTGGLIGFAVWAFRLQAELKATTATGAGPNVSGVATQSVFAPSRPKSEQMRRKAASAARAVLAWGSRLVPRTSSAKKKWALVATCGALALVLARFMAPIQVQVDASGDWTQDYMAGERKTATINDVTYAFRYCPAGTFTMGSPESEDGRNEDERQHSVTLSSFWLLETEVTQEMWTTVMGDNPSRYDSDVRNPVDSISWEDCQKFIKRLNASAELPDGWVFRLPTEAEWEYACRAGTTGAYNVDGASLGALGWWISHSNQTHTVGGKLPNAWGLYDMHGNVSEWCFDRYGGYALGAQTNPTGPTLGSYRVLRGGGCYSSYAEYCRSAYRDDGAPTHRDFNYGFRLALGREL